MQDESLDQLKIAFEDWRSKKRYPREAVPAELLERARLAARRHGPTAVARATKVDRGRLRNGNRSRPVRRPLAKRAPAFSRVQLAAPTPAAQPFAELETASGVKIRLFSQTDEVLGLLSALCGSGGGR